VTEFSTADFVPLDDFPLLWRWTRRSYDLLPAPALATIRPLGECAAAAVAPEAAARCGQVAGAAIEFALDTGGEDASAVRSWLARLEIPAVVPVIVSWAPHLAIVTCWETFAQHWDAFCYPASDDVTVWAPGDGWTLCYHHFERLEYVHRRPAT
jgi:hypothetical protein